MFSLKKQPASPSRRRSCTVQKATRQRRPTFEPLEDRRLLAVSPEWLVTLANDASLYMPYVAGHADGGFSVTGRFSGTHDFDPGPGETILSNGGQPWGGGSDVVIARFSDSGGLMWARQIGGNDPAQSHMDAGVATDRLGNTYVVGVYQSFVQIGGQSFTGDARDGFITKLDADGNFVWAQPLKASSSLLTPRDVHGVTVDDRDANPANWSVFVAAARPRSAAKRINRRGVKAKTRQQASIHLCQSSPPVTAVSSGRRLLAARVRK